MLASLCPRLSHGCQDTRTGRSENNGLLISSFQKEEVAIVGNFCDQWSWLTVSSLVSQALASLCCQPGWGLGALQLLGLPGLFWGATAFAATSSCGSARGTACPAAHPLCGAPGGCGACATSCSVLLAPGGLCCLAGGMGPWQVTPHLPGPGTRLPRHAETSVWLLPSGLSGQSRSAPS